MNPDEILEVLKSGAGIGSLLSIPVIWLRHQYKLKLAEIAVENRGVIHDGKSVFDFRNGANVAGEASNHSTALETNPGAETDISRVRLS